MQRLADNRDVPETRRGTVPKNIHKLKENDQVTFYSHPTASTKEPEEREFVVDSRASTHMVQQERLLTLLSWRTMRTSRSPDDGDDGQRRGANKRRSHGIRQRIGTKS